MNHSILISNTLGSELPLLVGEIRIESRPTKDHDDHAI